MMFNPDHRDPGALYYDGMHGSDTGLMTAIRITPECTKLCSSIGVKSALLLFEKFTASPLTGKAALIFPSCLFLYLYVA